MVNEPIFCLNRKTREDTNRLVMRQGIICQVKYNRFKRQF